MCPTLVVGFAAFIVLGETAGAYVAYVVAIAARFAFCLITQMYFARYAVQGAATPVQSYGLGWIFVHLGDLLGVVTLVLVESGMAAGVFSLDQVAVVSIALLVGATMFVLSDGRAFAFGARNEDGVLHDAASKRSMPAGADAASSAFAPPASSSLPNAAASPRARPRCSTSWRAADRYRTCATLSSSRARRPPPTPSTSTPNSTCTPAKSSSTSCIRLRIAACAIFCTLLHVQDFAHRLFNSQAEKGPYRGLS